MDVSVCSGDLGAQTFEFHTLIEYRVHGSGAQFCHHIGKRVVGCPAVDHESVVITGNLDERIRQHGFVELHQRNFRNLVMRMDQLIVRNLALQNVVAYKHTERIPRILIIIVSAYLDIVVTSIIVPAGSRHSTFAINAISIGFQVFHVVNAFIGQSLVGLSKDGVTQLTLFRQVKAATVVN